MDREFHLVSGRLRISERFVVLGTPTPTEEQIEEVFALLTDDIRKQDITDQDIDNAINVVLGNVP